MRQRLRGAVIGCGFFAENHLNAWASIPDVELVADGRVHAESPPHSIGKHVYLDDAA